MKNLSYGLSESFLANLFHSSVCGSWARHLISEYLFVRPSVCHTRDLRRNGSRCPNSLLFKSHDGAMFFVGWSQNFAILRSGVHPCRTSALTTAKIGKGAIYDLNYYYLQCCVHSVCCVVLHAHPPLIWLRLVADVKVMYHCRAAADAVPVASTRIIWRCCPALSHLSRWQEASTNGVFSSDDWALGPNFRKILWRT